MIPAKTGLDLYRFCKDKPPFSEWSTIQLLHAIADATRDGIVAYTLDSNGNLDGVCLGRRLDPGAIYITGIYTPPGLIRSVWLKTFHDLHKGQTLFYQRRKTGKLIKLS